MQNPNMTTGSLASKAILVALKISEWEARKFDKEATRRLHETLQASADSGRYNKALISRDAIRRFQKISGDAREFHYKATLPWEDAGARLLPAERWGAYSARMAEFQTAFEAEVQDFIGNYSNLIDEARERLNGMFRAADYPTLESLRCRFAFAVKVRPVPTAGDLRVGLDEQEMERIRQEMEASAQAAISNATADLIRRLQEVIEHVHERLSVPDKIFRDSLLGNVRAVLEAIGHLNITKDPDLERLRSEAEKTLLGVEPQDLRDDLDKRKAAASAADAMLRKMGGLLGGAK